MHSIGDLARRSGLPVRTIRFYSDAGVVPESARSPAGYRRYDHEAVTRLDLVRTLRELGLPLDTIRRLLAAQTSLTQVASTHVSMLDESSGSRQPSPPGSIRRRRLPPRPSASWWLPAR